MTASIVRPPFLSHFDSSDSSSRRQLSRHNSRRCVVSLHVHCSTRRPPRRCRRPLADERDVLNCSDARTYSVGSRPSSGCPPGRRCAHLQRGCAAGPTVGNQIVRVRREGNTGVWDRLFRAVCRQNESLVGDDESTGAPLRSRTQCRRRGRRLAVPRRADSCVRTSHSR